MPQDKGVSASQTGLSSTTEPVPVSALRASIPDAGHRLCYVSGCWAYFTRLPLDEQWGDDWDDVPYEHNAGTPYADEAGQIISIAWEGPFDQPDWGHQNSPYSVKSINAGAIAWLRPYRWYESPLVVPAGVTIREFYEIVTGIGGTVYIPAQTIEARSDETACGLGRNGESVVGKADAPITALQSRITALEKALEPFAACCEYIRDDEDDEEWAKFRLLIKDYRAAHKALKGDGD